MKTALASALPFSVGLAFAVGYAAWHGTLSWFVLALPLVVAFQLVAMVGVAFLLAAGGVFFRDLRDLVTVFCAVNLFAQPILYNPFATPRWLELVFLANPFSYRSGAGRTCCFTAHRCILSRGSSSRSEVSACWRSAGWFSSARATRLGTPFE
ncbi:MAG: hypothetical protein M5U30_05000 [Burkholderiaceae bacterium]|nr:hypothetical protein [Burkholderiaceae bacterium]